MYAPKNFLMPEHPLLEGIRNVEVIKLMQSLVSRGYCEEQFVWQHLYWTLTDEVAFRMPFFFQNYFASRVSKSQFDLNSLNEGNNICLNLLQKCRNKKILQGEFFCHRFKPKFRFTVDESQTSKPQALL